MNKQRDQRGALPHITVATVVEKDGEFLFVEEGNAPHVLNQPAGHLDPGETLIRAAERETLEETCWYVRINAYLGVSQYLAPNGITYVRHSFAAEPLSFSDTAQRDPDIHDTHWLTYEALLSHPCRPRSPLVINDLERYREGKRFSLACLEGFISRSAFAKLS